MKVNNNKLPGAGPKLDGVKGGKADATSALNKEAKSASLGANTIRQNSNVELSERAQMMQKAKALAGGADSIDEAKVARLQKMIDEGKYKVDAGAIADRLVDEHLLTSE
jgi:negative regulator of flagellin synthesis FlgM